MYWRSLVDSKERTLAMRSFTTHSVGVVAFLVTLVSSRSVTGSTGLLICLEHLSASCQTTINGQPVWASEQFSFDIGKCVGWIS